jgi:hypothetical protein
LAAFFLVALRFGAAFFAAFLRFLAGIPFPPPPFGRDALLYVEREPWRL